jgi:ParB family transcriptional regulator, chromosome partitioning protein
MATAVQKITLSASRDIPFNKLVLSQANVRRVKAGVSIEELAEDIARRTLLQGLSVRAVVDADGNETGIFEVPAGGRRFRALELLVKQKRLAKTAPVPCVVRDGGDRRGGFAGRERPARRAASARPVPRLPCVAREGPGR